MWLIVFDLSTFRSPRHNLDRIDNQPRRLDRRMQGQILPSAAPHRVDRGIVPDIGAVAAMLAEFDHVAVRRCSDPVDKDQFEWTPAVGTTWVAANSEA